MSAAASSGGLVPTRALFHESWKWLRRNWVRTLVFSILSFVIAWIWNVWIMARKLEGSVADPGSSTTATAQGKTWNGIYWLLCTTILFGLITYGREKGFKNLVREFFTPPFTFFDNLFRRPRSAIAMGCWGAALALLIGSIVSNAISGLLGLGFLLAAPTALAIVLNNVLIRAWIGAFSAAQPRLRGNAMGLANPYAMMFGEAVGAIIAWRVDGAVIPVVLALILVVVSFVAVMGGAGRPLPNPMPLVLFVGAGVVAWRVLHTTPARADDGGWTECATASGEPCSSLGLFRGWWEWRKSAGADAVIRQGRVGGTFSALGCVVGCMLGGGLAALAAAFSSSSTGGLGTGVAGASPSGAPPGGTPPPPAPAGHGIAQGLDQPPAGQPATPPPAAPAGHGIASSLDQPAPGSPGAPPPGSPGAPPAPSPVARAASSPLSPPPPGSPPGPPPSGPPPPAPSPHGIAHGLQDFEGHGGAAGATPDVTPTGAARQAPDLTPDSTHAQPPEGSPHGIAHGLQDFEGHGGAAGATPDVTPTGAARHAPDLTPDSTHGDVTPTGAARHAPDLTPDSTHGDVTPTGAARHAPDLTPDATHGQPPPPPPGGQQPPPPGRRMLDDVLPDEDKVEEEDDGEA